MLTKPQEQWLTALESGDYRQGRGNLHRVLEDGEYFCCLGVACHLFKEELGLNYRVDVDNDVVKYNDEARSLPSVVKEHLMFRGFADESLACFNDTSRKTFKEIAAMIRTNPFHYFTKEIDNHVN